MAYSFPEAEKNILKFWADKKVFEKLRKKNTGKKPWSFLDGPITANNPMGVHHAWGRTYKDVFQRYKAMQGFDERYQNGFDCQGLWVEVEVEKELGFKNKKDIEVYGIDKFVEKCKERVRKYSEIQTAQSIRLGQWMDWDNSYYTMSDENNYAIWHFLKKCWELGYLYKGRDSVPWCPRCGTAISQHEILQEEYHLVAHMSLVLKLPIKKNEYLLAWTTTPWSVPGVIALMINPEFDYVKVSQKDGIYILAKERVSQLKGPFKIVEEFKGKKLLKETFRQPYQDFPALKGQRFPIIPTEEFVTLDIGTGVVTNNPGVGHEDYLVAKEADILPLESVDEGANFLEGYGWLSSKNAKDKQVTKEILEDLQKRGFVYDSYEISHRYPVCWRCKTELIFRSVDEWYISTEKLRKPLEKIAKKITWIPSFGLDRELDWLKNMHDWLISKKRYWGLTLPIFECECGHFEVIGSKEELKKRAIEGWEHFENQSPHRPWIDYIKIKCKKCKKLVSRIKDVGNPWLDAGIVPFSTLQYFTNRSYWKKWFPADMVCESFPGQFKNWFYSMLVMSAVLEDTVPMETIFGYATVVDEKGEEMHKSKGNAIWFDDAVEKVGVDPMRWLYMKANPADNMRFGYTIVEEVKKRLLILYNVYVFFTTYVKKEEFPSLEKVSKVVPKNILDKWITSKMEHLVASAQFNLDSYDVAKAVIAIEDFFINDLSLWYVRRSRARFHETSYDRKEAINTLYIILLSTTKIISPFVPFFAEQMYQHIKTEGMSESVHLCDWPMSNNQTDLDLEAAMDQVRSIVTLALAERAAKAIKVRQPLAHLKVKSSTFKALEESLLDLIKDEVNVKKVVFDDTIEKDIELDVRLTEELKAEGMIRDMIRSVQDFRKEQGLKPEDKISAWFFGSSFVDAMLDKNRELLMKEIRAKEIFIGESPDNNLPTKEIKVEEETYNIIIKKI